MTAALLTITAALASPARAAGTDVQQAEAIAKPSVVFVETQWKGYLTRGTYGGFDVADALTDGNGHFLPLRLTTTCSGFVANEEGYVVTAGHCVDDQSVQDGGKGLLIDHAVDLVAQAYNKSHATPLSLSIIDDMRQTGYANWTIEGDDGGSPPDRVVRVYPTQAAFGTAASSALTANVVSIRPFKKGDVALLKVSTDTPWPALEIAPEGSSTDGTPVVAAGYPGAVTSTVDAGAEPSMNDGTISGQRTVNGTPFTQISPEIGAGMSGGPVLNAQGQVLGTVSWTATEQSQHFNFMTDTSTVRAILTTNDVGTTLSPTDRAYRKGLAEYFARKYREAAKDFEQVLTLEPTHAQAQNYHRLAVTKSPEEPLPVPPKPKASGPSPILLASIAVGVLVAIGTVAALLVVRRRRREQAPAAASTVEGGVLTEDTGLASRAGADSPAAQPASEDTLAILQEAVEPREVAIDEIQPDETSADGPGAGVERRAGSVPEQRSTAEGTSLGPPAEPGPGSLHLFVTYAREDRALVDRLRVGLQRLRHEVWVDDRLVVGDAWWEVILRQIRQSDAVLVAVSPALLQSQASAREQEYARRLGKVILPVSVRPVRPELMPPDLASLQMVDYSDPDVSAAFELADALAHLPASPELPDPLPEPPPVPLSYLSDLTARVRAPSLTLDEQLALVARLRSALSKPTEHQPALELLRTLQGREDLYIGPAREIDAILANGDVILTSVNDALTEGQSAETTPEPS